MTISPAQTPKDLSSFYLPMRRTTPSGEPELKGISISRLKSKMGTRALPTAELGLKGARAFLLGDEGKGIQEISTMLNLTWLQNSVVSIGMLLTYFTVYCLGIANQGATATTSQT
jgi:alkylation response protein AidB-like acyl-CoA dehydrogenase